MFFIEALQTIEGLKDKWVATHDEAMFNLKDCGNVIRVDRQRMHDQIMDLHDNEQFRYSCDGPSS